MDIQADFHPKLELLFRPKRYKVMYGGRGAGRSWGVARALLIMGTQRPLRVLCTRELQNSISESVHKLLCDQIDILKLGSGPEQAGFYKIQEARIFAPNGTEFFFGGIRNNTDKIRSYEGVDICWVEEAAKVSRRSWRILTPTIRKTDAEIWLTFNPELETDYTYVRFVKNHDPETTEVVKMTYHDNPWFENSPLKADMEYDKKTDYDGYLHVWEGHCIQNLDGAIYAKEIRQSLLDGRICDVPWDPTVPVDTFWDLGRRDHTSIWFVQRVAMQWRMVRFYQGTGFDIGHYIKYLKDQPYNYGCHYLPHDGKAKQLGSKRSIEEQVRAASGSWEVRVTPRAGLTDGINAVRLMFPTLWFDEKNCEEGIECLKNYRYKVKDGQFSDQPLHDQYSDGADALRNFGMNARGPRGPSKLAQRLGLGLERASTLVDGMAGLGWMGR